MKIAMISEHASPLATLGGVDAGGQNVHVAALAAALGARGHRVTVYTRRDAPDLPVRVPFAHNVIVEHVPAGPPEEVPKDELFQYMPAFAEHLSTRLRRSRPALVHSHFWMSGWAALRATRGLDVPVAHTYHALGVTKRRHQGGKDTSPQCRLDVETCIAREADQIIATSSEEVFELRRMGAPANRIGLVPCGVEVDHFTPGGPRAERGDRRRIVVVSRMVERKGIGDVIEALAGVPAAELLIAGGPPHAALDDDAEARRLAALSRTCGVADRVQLLGRVDHAVLPELYRSADVVACVPWYEPFGLVALEAMACGVPVVASAVGGLVDTVIHGVTGFHVPPRDPRAIAAALTAMLADSARATAFGRAGAARARHSYRWDAVAAETARAYVRARGGATKARRNVG